MVAWLTQKMMWRGYYCRDNPIIISNMISCGWRKIQFAVWNAAAETAAALAVAAVAAVAGLRCSPLQFHLSAQQQGRTRQLFTGYYKTLAQPRLYIEIKRVIVEFMQTLNYLSDLFFHFLTCSLVSVTHIVRFRIERSFFTFFVFTFFSVRDVLPVLICKL